MDWHNINITLSDLISVTALLVSLFTFYWLNLRDKYSLKLVRVENFNHEHPQFILHNGGNHEVYITSIQCLYRDKEGNGAYPMIANIHDQGNNFSIASGKHKNCLISFHSPSGLVDLINENGIINKEKGCSTTISKVMEIEISWVDSKGRHFEASCEFEKHEVGTEEVKFHMTRPLVNSIELYKLKKDKPWAGDNKK